MMIGDDYENINKRKSYDKSLDIDGLGVAARGGDRNLEKERMVDFDISLIDDLSSGLDSVSVIYCSKYSSIVLKFTVLSFVCVREGLG